MTHPCRVHQAISGNPPATAGPLNAPKHRPTETPLTNIRASIPIAISLSGNHVRWPTRETVAVLVLEARAARASLVATDLRPVVPTLCGQLRCQLDSLRQCLKLGFPMTEVLASAPKPLLGRRYCLFPTRNLGLSVGQLLTCSLRQHRGIVARDISRACQLPVDQRDDGSTHRDPGCAAVTFPRRPLRRRHRQAHHVEPLISVGLGQQPPIEIRQGAAIEPHHAHRCLRVYISNCVACACGVDRGTARIAIAVASPWSTSLALGSAVFGSVMRSPFSVAQQASCSLHRGPVGGLRWSELARDAPTSDQVTLSLRCQRQPSTSVLPRTRAPVSNRRRHRKSDTAAMLSRRGGRSWTLSSDCHRPCQQVVISPPTQPAETGRPIGIVIVR